MRLWTKRSTVRRISLAYAIFGAFVLTSCAGLRLHEPELATLATEAKAKSDAVDFTAIIDAERTNQTALLQHELSVLGAHMQSARDTELRYLLAVSFDDLVDRNEDARDTSRSLSAKLDRRLTATALEEFDILNAAEDLIWVQNGRDTAASSRKALGDFSIKVPACPRLSDELDNDPMFLSKIADKHPAFSDMIQAYWPLCQTYLNDEAAFEEKYAGAVPGLRRAQELEAAVQAELSAASTSLKAATEAVRTAEKDLKLARASHQNEDVIGDLAQSLKDKTDKLVEVRNALDNEDLNIAICGINTIIAAAQTDSASEPSDADADDGTKTCDQDTQSDVITEIKGKAPALVSFLRNAVSIRQAANRAPLEALILEKERLEYRRDLDRNRLRRLKQKEALIHEYRDAVTEEITLLSGAKQRLKWARKANLHGEIFVDDLYAPDRLNIHTRRYLLEAIATYLGVYTGPRQRQREIEYELVALSHSDILDRSESALDLWASVIKGPVSQIAAYHQAGIKREEIIALLQAGGLVATGVGTVE